MYNYPIIPYFSLLLLLFKWGSWEFMTERMSEFFNDFPLKYWPSIIKNMAYLYLYALNILNYSGCLYFQLKATVFIILREWEKEIFIIFLLYTQTSIIGFWDSILLFYPRALTALLASETGTLKDIDGTTLIRGCQNHWCHDFSNIHPCLRLSSHNTSHDTWCITFFLSLAPAI